ncbi:MAG: FadR/GntR family transcriptional regulator [Clostridia bacterium]|jgi:GntR family transcriptional repressor for pyruvate dehydrogenase complex|nr:FadR/GntR family transcriptional regulator [Clostridia bacterium]
MVIPTEEQSLNKLIDKSSDTLYVQIVERIRQWIMQGYLKEGDPLPSERELAQIFDVSRVPVREALKIMEFLGVVQHIRGKGVFVKKININNVLNNIDFLIVDPISGLHDFFEAREAIESQSAGLAAERRKPEDLEAMEEAIWEMERNIQLKRDVKGASLRFHAAVIAASHNIVLMKIYEFLSELLNYSLQESFKDLARYEPSLEHHKQIFQKIKEQDRQGAIEAMQKHIRESGRSHFQK